MNHFDPSGRFLIDLLNNMKIRANMAAYSFLATYGAYAEGMAFIMTIDFMKNMQLIATGIDPETGEEADFTSYAFVALSVLPGDEYIQGPLKTAAKQKFRKGARYLFEAAGKAIDGKFVHHKIPLEWAHLFPDRNPNAKENLIAIGSELHDEVGRTWTQFREKFKNLGRDPTLQEVEEMLKITDKIIGDDGIVL